MHFKYLEWIIVFLFFLINISLFNLHPINYEYAFVDAAKYFQTYDKNILKDYSKIQSNTLGLSFLIYFLSKVFFFENLFIIGKFISASSYFILYFAFRNFNKFFNYKYYIFLLIVLFLNPLVWIYSSRISADIFPASVIVLSVSFLLSNVISKKRLLLSACLFLIGIILKPNLLILISLPILIIFFKNKNFKKNIFYISIFALINILGLTSYYFYSIKSFGFFITTINSLNSFSGLVFVLNNFITYLGIMCIFLMPFMLNNFKEKFNLRNSIFIISFFLVTHFSVPDKTSFGEIGLGPFDFFSHKTLKALYLSLSILFIINLIDIFKKIEKRKKKNYLIIIFSILLYIFILSFFRPAQRYLIPAMLLIYVLIFHYIVSIKIIILTIFLFVLLNFYSTINNINRSIVSKKIILYLLDNNLLYTTSPGIVTDSFNWVKINRESNQEKKYLIKLKDKDCIKSFESKIFFFKKDYCLAYNDQ